MPLIDNYTYDPQTLPNPDTNRIDKDAGLQQRFSSQFVGDCEFWIDADGTDAPVLNMRFWDMQSRPKRGRTLALLIGQDTSWDGVHNADVFGTVATGVLMESLTDNRAIYVLSDDEGLISVPLDQTNGTYNVAVAVGGQVFQSPDVTAAGIT